MQKDRRKARHNRGIKLTNSILFDKEYLAIIKHLWAQ